MSNQGCFGLQPLKTNVMSSELSDRGSVLPDISSLFHGHREELRVFLLIVHSLAADYYPTQKTLSTATSVECYECKEGYTHSIFGFFFKLFD